MEACKRKFESTGDPNIIVPALAGLSQDEIVAALPKLLDPPPLFGAALARILLPSASGIEKQAFAETEAAQLLFAMLAYACQECESTSGLIYV